MSVLPISEEDRKNVPYIEYGDIFKTKVADLDKMVEDLRKEREKSGKSNIIEVKAIRTKREKEINKVIKYAKDKVTGIYYGIVIGTYDDGNIKWRGIYLTDYNSFNINNDLEAKSYLILRMHPLMKGSILTSSEDPMFEILDPDEIADVGFSKAMLIKTALHKISIMKNETVEPFARFLGVGISSTMTNKMIKKSLTDLAIVEPQKLIDAFEDRNRPLFEMIAMARKHSIIKYDTERGHLFQDKFLGYTMPEVARVLETEELVLARVRQKLEEFGYAPGAEKNKKSSSQEDD